MSSELPGPISQRPEWILRRIGLSVFVTGVVMADLFIRDLDTDSADPFPWAAAILSVALVVVGVLLALRVRWSPEIFAAISTAYLLLFVAAIALGGPVEPSVLFILAFVFCLARLFPRARRAMRELSASKIPALPQ